MAGSAALVTGASSGIGEAIVHRLLADGLVVYAAARRVERMSALEQLGARTIAMDVTRDDDVLAAVKRIEREAGGVDVLVNNAGFGLYGPAEEVPIDDARYQFEVNLFGLARLTQLVLPHMRAAGRGTIVNISSMGGRVYTPLGAWYHATKHALEGWSDCLRLEVGPHGIDVVVVQPGIIDTGFEDVMRQHVGRYSDGPYADIVTKTLAASTNAYADGSAPVVVANVVGNAVGARRPRTRYKVGALARPMMYARKWLPDRAFDRIVLRAYDRYAPR